MCIFLDFLLSFSIFLIICFFLFFCFSVSFEWQSSYFFSYLTLFLRPFFFTYSPPIVILTLWPNVYFSFESFSNFSNYIIFHINAYFLYFSSLLISRFNIYFYYFYFTNWHVSFSLQSSFFFLFTDQLRMICLLLSLLSFYIHDSLLLTFFSRNLCH